MNATLEDKIHNKMTWFRAPLMIIVIALLVLAMHETKTFWYGAAVAIFGEMIQMWASSQIHKDKKLTISGPYSYVRNPMYIGRFFVFLGLFIIAANPYLITAYVLFFAYYAQIRVKREEGRLKVIFEPDYQHYCTEINRWFPKFKAYSRSESQGASWGQIQENHEQINLMCVLFALAMIYVRLHMFADFRPF